MSTTDAAALWALRTAFTELFLLRHSIALAPIGALVAQAEEALARAANHGP